MSERRLSILPPPKQTSASSTGTVWSDSNDEMCTACGDHGELLCCDMCPSAFHLSCAGLRSVPEGQWVCDICTGKTSHAEFLERRLSMRSLRARDEESDSAYSSGDGSSSSSSGESSDDLRACAICREKEFDPARGSVIPPDGEEMVQSTPSSPYQPLYQPLYEPLYP